MPRYQSFFNLLRPIMDSDPVGNLPPPIFAPHTRTAFGMAKPQPANHLSA